MSKTITIFKRELKGYFATPVAYVFIVVFLLLTTGITFYLANIYEGEQADLQGFFGVHPWIYLFLIAAIAMRLWSEERRTGTIELLMTLPITVGNAVLGKFLAAWAFCGLSLALTVPTWITINYLGEPDNGVIVTSYLGSFLMAGAYLAIGSCISAATKNQVIAFVLSVAACLFLVLIGFPRVLDLLQPMIGTSLVSVLQSMSFLTHFEDVRKGVIDMRDVVFFISVIIVFLIANGIIVNLKKAD